MTVERPSVSSILCSRGELLAWAQRLGAKELSPLVRFTADVSPPPMEGELDDHQESAMEVLAAPSSALFACLVAQDRVTLWEFHSSGDGYVGVWPEGDGVRINGPISALALGRFFAELIGADNAVDEVVAEGLSLDAISAFAAVADASRWIDRPEGSTPSAGLHRSRILAALDRGRREEDVHSMVSVWAAALPGLGGGSALDLDVGLKDLKSRGLLLDGGETLAAVGLSAEVASVSGHSRLLAVDAGGWQMAASDLGSRILVATCGAESGWLGVMGTDRFAGTLEAALTT